MTRRATIRLIAGALGVVAVVAGWLVLGPVQLAGGTTYALVVGNSMEPRVERGDLVLVRSRDSYRPGDVVLYESTALGAKVLHRIVRIEDGRFVVKGDNNDFVDEERPTEAQIAGTLAMTVPVVGRLAGWLRSPVHSALFVGLVTLLAFGGIGARGRGRLRVDAPHLVSGVAVAIAAFGVLAVVSFARPTTATQAVAQR
jgi:signal peptidase I